MCKRICWPTVHLETFHGGIKICGILRPFRRLSCRRPFCPSFKTVSLCALSAHFPDYALGAELAVGAGIGAGLAVLEAFLAIADRHLLALDKGLAARVISAFHDSSFIFRHLPNRDDLIKSLQGRQSTIIPALSDQGGIFTALQQPSINNHQS